MFPRFVVIGLAMVALGGISASAQAHKVNLFAYAEGDQIYVQGYFSDGKTAKNSEVTIFGGDGRELTKGQTNEEGVFTFPIQSKQALRIVLNAGQGHQATYELPIEEAMAATPSQPSPVVSTRFGDPTPTEGGDVVSAGEPLSVSESMVRKAVAQAVLPLAREIDELKERRGFSDMVGGVGFIVGLLGVFAYVKARQESRKKNN